MILRQFAANIQIYNLPSKYFYDFVLKLILFHNKLNTSLVLLSLSIKTPLSFYPDISVFCLSVLLSKIHSLCPFD